MQFTVLLLCFSRKTSKDVNAGSKFSAQCKLTDTYLGHCMSIAGDFGLAKMLNEEDLASSVSDHWIASASVAWFQSVRMDTMLVMHTGHS
jgi:hypothetical protein